MPTKTIEQERAAHALAGVKSVANKASKEFKSYAKEFKSCASGFPMMIHTNGLGQAVAFYAGKKEDEYKELLKMLTDWLTSDDRLFAKNSELIEAITQNDMQTYMLAQAEAMAYLVWVKKFAKAFMDDEVQNEQSAAI